MFLDSPPPHNKKAVKHDQFDFNWLYGFFDLLPDKILLLLALFQ